MPFLNTFDYEIFLSYGWGGNAAEGEGARRWASRLRDLIVDEFSADLQKPRIFLDVDSLRTGLVAENIYRALDRSALLLFAVSPGSYRADSWCQKEVAWFWDRARPLVNFPQVFAPEDRVLKVIQSPVQITPEQEPLPLRGMPVFDLSQRVLVGGNDVFLAGDLSQPESEPLRGQLIKLRGAVRQSLEKAKEIEKNETSRPSGKRVFLGPAFSELDQSRVLMLRRELLLEGHEVLSVTPLPPAAESEDGHQVRIERTLDNERSRVDLAVHLLQPAVPDFGWASNPAAMQIGHCLRKSTTDKSFCVFLWRDPGQTVFDPSSLRQIEEILPTQGDQNAQGMTFGDLKSNVKSLLRKTPRVTSTPSVFARFDVVIEHHDIDSAEAKRIREYIKVRYNRKAQFANPTLPKSNGARRIRKNTAQFYERSDRFLVLYGQTDDDWTNEVCFAMLPHINVRKGGLVLIAPPEAPPLGKKYYEAPDDDRFETKTCFDRNYEPLIDEWLLTSGLDVPRQ